MKFVLLTILSLLVLLSILFFFSVSAQITAIDEKPTIKCDEENISYIGLVPTYHNITTCSPKPLENCSTRTIIRYVNDTKYIIQCEPDTKTVVLNDQIIDYEKNDIVCIIHKDNIICDDEVGHDGNGDGICQPGETCYTFEIKDQTIIEPIIYNGEIKLEPDSKLITIKEISIEPISK